MPPTSKIRKLSKGMAQLVQLLGSIVHQPELLVLDEPFSGLDPVNQERLEALIRRRARSRRDDPVLDPCHGACRAAVRPAGDHRRAASAASRAPSPMRAALLPMRAHYVPHHDAAASPRLLPSDARAARATAGASPCPTRASRRCSCTLIDAGYGISGLSIERPGLHDAFVRIVGKRDALEEVAGMSRRSPHGRAPDADDRAARFHRDGVHADLPVLPARAADHGRRSALVGGLGASSMARGRGRQASGSSRSSRPTQTPRRCAPPTRGCARLFAHGRDRRRRCSVEAPGADPQAQARAAFDARRHDVDAVLYGPLDRPQILYGGTAAGAAPTISPRSPRDAARRAAAAARRRSARRR